jgi:hypothetical protein
VPGGGAPAAVFVNATETVRPESIDDDYLVA